MKNGVARPTKHYIRYGDKTVYQLYTDGSYRRFPPKARGKARVKALKRMRHAAV